MEEVISQHPAFRGHYQIVIEKQGPMDALSINMEVTDSLFSGNIKDLLHIQKDLQERIRSTFFISADVKLVEEGSIPRSIGKAQRVIDKRGEQQ